MFLDVIKKAIKKPYHTLNIIEISKKRLIGNYLRLSLIDKGIKVAPVLKSNAYGHGLVEVAKILDSLQPPFFCVDSLHEAYELYKAKIKSGILIMGYINPKNLAIKELPFSYVVYDLIQLKQIFIHQPQAKIHIFVDTGMHREGVLMDDLEKFVKYIPKNRLGNIEGLMSHFAASEEPERYETKQQVKNFKKAIEILNKNKIFPKWIHIANSYGLLNSQTLGLGKISNLARTGLSLYDSVLRFVTHINQIKKIKKGDKVGYNFTYTAKKDLAIAVLPVGYNDGVDRGFSNIGKVLLKGGVTCPIIGRVSMNITTVDISSVKHAKVGDEVEIYFNIPIKGKILYEFLVHLERSTKRKII